MWSFNYIANGTGEIFVFAELYQFIIFYNIIKRNYEQVLHIPRSSTVLPIVHYLKFYEYYNLSVISIFHHKFILNRDKIKCIAEG